MSDTWVKPNKVKSQWQFLDDVGNLWLNITSCVFSAVWVCTSYTFLIDFLPPSMGR